MRPRSRKRKRNAGRRNADFSTVPEGRRPDKKAFRRNAQPHNLLCVQRGLGALPPTSRLDLPLTAGGPILHRGSHDALLATITKAPKVQEIAVLFSGSYLSYNERETGLTVPCLSCHARSCKLSAGPLIAAFDLRRLKHRSVSVYSCNKAS